MQRAAYVRAIECLLPHLSAVDFVWLFVEEHKGDCKGDPRVSVTAARGAESLVLHGDSRWRRACGLWAECLASDSWPGYASGVIEIEVPPWALARESSLAWLSD